MTAPDPPPARAWDVLLSRPVGAVVTLLALALAVELVPGMARLRLLGARPERAVASTPGPTPTASVGAARLSFETKSSGVAVAAGSHSRLPIAETEDDTPLDAKNAPPLPFEDPTGRALDGFYRALGRADAKEPHAVARIAHFGDSLIVSDFVSGTLRRALQRRFGDAGHGFVLMANAWPSYSPWDADRYATSGWEVSTIVGPYSADGWYGLGGVSFRAEKNVLARIGTATSGSFGRKVSRFVVAYVEDPAGGRFQLRVDDAAPELIDTRGAEKHARFHEILVPDGAHQLELQTLSGESRLFGVVLERDVPGVVLDALGVQGARIRFLDKQDDAHFAEQLAWRQPNLVVYEFGANESSDGFVFSMADFHRTMRDVLAQTKRALPEASCLVIGAMDRAAKQGDQLVSVRVVPALVEEQRQVALEMGCAFFDTYRAMGGKGSMPRWVKRGLAQADFVHPSGAGAERLGTWIYGAMLDGYAAFRAREHSDSGIPRAAPSAAQ